MPITSRGRRGAGNPIMRGLVKCPATSTLLQHIAHVVRQTHVPASESTRLRLNCLAGARPQLPWSYRIIFLGPDSMTDKRVEGHSDTDRPPHKAGAKHHFVGQLGVGGRKRQTLCRLRSLILGGDRTQYAVGQTIQFKAGINHSSPQRRNLTDGLQLPTKGFRCAFSEQRRNISTRRNGRAFPATANNSNRNIGFTANLAQSTITKLESRTCRKGFSHL